MVFLIQRCLSPRGRSSARFYARWALQSSFVVLGVSPVRSLCAEAVQIDVLKTSGTLAVRILTLANHAPPCDCIRRKVELPRALLSLGCFAVSRRKGARRSRCGLREWNALSLGSGVLTAAA